MKPGSREVIPVPVPGLSQAANAAIRLSSIAEILALEDRKLVRHSNGRAENVAEHSFSLSIVAPEIAERMYPNLNSLKVIKFVRVHDILEAYTGDVNTHDFATVDLTQKEADEALALERFEKDFVAFPSLIRDVKEYEAQQIPEARFVRVVDKIMPILIHVHDKGATLSSYTDAETLRSRTSARNNYLIETYPEYNAVVMLREELTQYVGSLIGKATSDK